MKYIRKFGITLNLAGSLALLVSYLAPYLDPGKILLPGLVSLFYPYLLLANILFLLLWISLRSKFLLISLASLLAGWNMHGRFVQFSGTDAADWETDRVLNCMTYNVRWLRHVPPYDPGQPEEKIGRMISKIRTGAPELDILCMEEGGHGQLIGEALGLPHVMKADKMSTWLMSRHPVIRSGTLFLKDTERGFAAWMDIAFNSDTIRVYGLHLKSNKITVEAEELMHDIRIRERATWIRVQDILSKYGKATVIRAAEARQLRDEIERSPHPVIVLGDFNDTPFSYAYQVIRAGLTDSFIAAGKGIGTTYAGQLPSLRIDNILADPAFKVLRHERPEWDYSDHYPVIASLGTP